MVAAAGDGAGATGDLPVTLSSMRRADVSEYRGKLYVNVREYYSVRRRARCYPSRSCAPLREHDDNMQRSFCMLR